MAETISRRKMLGMAAGAAAAAVPGSRWIFALNGEGHIVKAVARDDAPPWEPQFFTPDQAEAMARLCEAIIPRTDTPGARDARVHEFIDLELSITPKAAQETFLKGLGWLRVVCAERFDTSLDRADSAQIRELLSTISDERDELPAALAIGGAFFADIKRRTIFAYYTSKEGWVQELGRPETVGMEQWQGCGQGDDR